MHKYSVNTFVWNCKRVETTKKKIIYILIDWNQLTYSVNKILILLFDSLLVELRFAAAADDADHKINYYFGLGVYDCVNWFHFKLFWKWRQCNLNQWLRISLSLSLSHSLSKCVISKCDMWFDLMWF